MEKVEGEHTPFTRVVIIGQSKQVNNTNNAPSPNSKRGADYQERIKIDVVKMCRPSLYLDMLIEWCKNSNFCDMYFHYRNDLLVIASLVVSLCPPSPFMVGEIHVSYHSLSICISHLTVNELMSSVVSLSHLGRKSCVVL